MDRTKLLLFITGLGLIAYGYVLLSVPPGTLPDNVIPQVKSGMFAVMGGALLTVIALLRRS